MTMTMDQYTKGYLQCLMDMTAIILEGGIEDAQLKCADNFNLTLDEFRECRLDPTFVCYPEVVDYWENKLKTKKS